MRFFFFPVNALSFNKRHLDSPADLSKVVATAANRDFQQIIQNARTDESGQVLKRLFPLVPGASKVSSVAANDGGTPHSIKSDTGSDSQPKQQQIVTPQLIPSSPMNITRTTSQDLSVYHTPQVGSADALTPAVSYYLYQPSNPFHPPQIVMAPNAQQQSIEKNVC